MLYQQPATANKLLHQSVTRHRHAKTLHSLFGLFIGLSIGAININYFSPSFIPDRCCAFRLSQRQVQTLGAELNSSVLCSYSLDLINNLSGASLSQHHIHAHKSIVMPLCGWHSAHETKNNLRGLHIVLRSERQAYAFMPTAVTRHDVSQALKVAHQQPGFDTQLDLASVAPGEYALLLRRGDETCDTGMRVDITP